MVESRRKIPNAETLAYKTNPLEGLLQRTDFNPSQQRAIGIIRGLELSPEEQSLLFLYHVFHESGTISKVKKIAGIRNTKDALSLIGRVMDSKELDKKYEEFYRKYNLDDPD